MKKAFKVLGYIILIVIVIVAGLIGYVKTALPNVGEAPVMTVDKTPEKVERGRYLANSVAACMDCHSTRDWNKYAGPLKEGTLGRGGERFDQQFGFPGVYYSRNITPAGIARYTDGELYRVITTGVNKEGKAMFTVMPYPYYGTMDPEDVKCIIAYLRTLAPITNEVAASVSDFPMSIIINVIPKKATPGKRPDTSNRIAYGAYLTNASACRECHTKEKQGQIIPELAFSGGRAFKLPTGGTVVSANITPDMATGIGNWTEEAFVNRFKTYADSSYHPQTISRGAFNSVMPWNMYCHMTRSDLGAIYTYLRSLPAKQNEVVKFLPEVVASK
ncbi:cytochrome C [Flavipsychrobacter stenotrophus]|uniref:Cytochrome C n=1 Tax=Flavipsychrobacter stenotrophus TaxID=2077091 RepID=A0A2S7SR30_9BACT|nr:c-type cytochrome [Flavipsychrobacter stenotrophus]PQJ09016.1 cytochrome C [Flavipsychrobacter stenotrophus]